MTKKSELTKDEMKNLIRKVVILFLFVPVFLGVLTLVPAGTFHYWQVYAYEASLVIPLIFFLVYFLRNDPAFLIRRMKTKEKEKTQRLIQIIANLLFFSAFIVCGLDRRFGWSDIPVFVVLLADGISLCGYAMVFFVYKENSFAARVIEVEKNQTVVTTGLYRFVRHPMYAGVIFMWLPIPIALGSFWGLIPISTIPVALVLRILNEEKVLNRDLPGYKEYCQKTKYRLIPFVW
ncbi:MAG: isoprenylcysteine carboxylmethyltransferase family protein [Bacteroidales bacterium]|nr:isoprenylcysteine carboxylmethyltransferase family protein [Bacteroidales bacterium]